MDIEQVYGGGNLKAVDLEGREFRLIISTAEVGEFLDDNKQPIKKIVLQFEGAKKSFVCNKTNAMLIAETYGSNTDNWIGKQITLYPDRVPYQGKIVDAIRVRLPMKAVSRHNGDERGQQSPIRRNDNITSGRTLIRPPLDVQNGDPLDEPPPF